MTKTAKILITLCMAISVVSSDDDSIDIGGFSPEEIINFLEQTVTLITNVEVTDSDVTFYLNDEVFTDLQLDPKADYSFLLKTKTTKIITHGWTGSYRDEFITNMTAEFLKLGFNVIKVDYARIAGTFYTVAVEHAPEIGELVGRFLVHQQLAADTTHLIGHSLGAHVMGFAAKIFSNSTGTKIARISGLDPAGPLYYTLPEKRLNIDDGHIVDIHHTDGLVLGTAESIGSLDVYYNGGLGLQPDCRNDGPIQTILSVANSVSCSHSKSTVYFTELINNEKANCTKCDSYTDYENGLCVSKEVYVFGEEDIDEIYTGKCYVDME